MDPILERYQALEDKVASYTPNLDTKRLYEAFTFADTEHHGQLRKSGEPYIIHPLAVADIVADLGLDVVLSIRIGKGLIQALGVQIRGIGGHLVL